MVGTFGEVPVKDWGLAKHFASAEAAENSDSPDSSDVSSGFRPGHFRGVARAKARADRGAAQANGAGHA